MYSLDSIPPHSAATAGLYVYNLHVSEAHVNPRAL